MNRYLLAITLSAAFFVNTAAQADPPPRPNVLIILTDDLGYGDLSSYGHPVIRTPHLDKLAEQGMRLTDCYAAAPVCSPARVGLLTGRTPTRVGVFDWIPNNHAMHMPRTEITVAQILKDAGYDTAMAGKWHCNGKFNSSDQPQPGDFGFDHWFATQNNAAPSHENPVNFVRNGERVGPIEGYACQIVADEGIRWLNQRQNRDRPFFLYISFHEPHEPVASPPDLVSQYVPRARNEDEAQYFANVANIDVAVGRLMAALDELGVAENTLVFFTSDNGPETLDRYPNANRSYGTPGPLRAMKLWVYEGGIRVPGILRYPARIRPGQVVQEPVSAVDILPTLGELAGATVPADRAIDGSSFVSIFDGEPVERHAPLYWHYYRALGEPVAAMRIGDWMVLGHAAKKPRPGFPEVADGPYIRAELTGFELYNLRNDLAQGVDLAERRPQRLRKLSRQLIQKHRQVIAEAPNWDD